VYLYNSERKGWIAAPRQLDSVYLENRRIEGAKWIIGEKEIFYRESSSETLERILNSYQLIRNEADYFVVKL
jgi:hypothetical protein